MEDVYKWCSQLENLRSELKKNKQMERVTNIRPESLDAFMKACKICNATCTKLGSVEEEVMFHGGDYTVTKEQVRIVFS